jgi:multiple sugar transport system substrate-binding protein
MVVRHGSRWLIAVAALVLPLTGGIGWAPASEAAQQVALQAWVYGSSGGALAQMRTEFEAGHPGITVNLTEFPEDQYTTKLDTALAAGDPPDVAYVEERRWIKAGMLLELDDVLAEAGVDLAAFNQGIMADQCLYEGKVYCIGTYTGAVVLFYNKDMFDAAGIPYPSTTEPMSVDEYAEMAAKLSNDAADINAKVWGGAAPPMYWWSDQRTHFSEDGRTVDGYLNDEPTVHAYDVLAGMVRDGNAPGSAALTAFGEAANLFGLRKQAMAIGDFSSLTTLEQEGIRYGVAPVPVERDGDAAWVPVWTDRWGIFADSANQDAAEAWIAFLATEGQRLQVEVEGNVPLDGTVADELDWPRGIEGRQEFLDVIALARPGIFVPGFWDATSVVEGAFDLMAAEGVPAQELIDESTADMQDIIDQAWETWEAVQ